MQLFFWRLLLDEELAPRVRGALTIADRSSSQDVVRQALKMAARGLVEAYGLTAAEAGELTENPGLGSACFACG
jgi:hypothetical protein